MASLEVGGRRGYVRRVAGIETRVWIGVDYGRARIGVAVSDGVTTLGHPRQALDGTQPDRAIRALIALAAQEGALGFVLGLPLDQRGQEGPMALAVRRFGDKLRQSSNGLRVEWVDERHTSQQAKRKGTTQIDSVSAAILLEAWLTRAAGRENSAPA